MARPVAGPRRKPGRPSKGVRKKIEIYVPVPLRDAVAAVAAGRGMTMTDYLTDLIERDTNVRVTVQEGLDFTSAA